MFNISAWFLSEPKHLQTLFLQDQLNATKSWLIFIWDRDNFVTVIGSCSWPFIPVWARQWKMYASQFDSKLEQVKLRLPREGNNPQNRKCVDSPIQKNIVLHIEWFSAPVGSVWVERKTRPTCRVKWFCFWAVSWHVDARLKHRLIIPDRSTTPTEWMETFPRSSLLVEVRWR